MTMPDKIYAAVNMRGNAWSEERELLDIPMKALDKDEYVREDLYTALQERNKRLVEALESANYTYLGGEYVACIDPDVCKQALAENKE